MRVLLIDNYDSFTFNLVHAVEPMVNELVVWRNDEFKIEDVASFDKIIFSPGPALPNQAGMLMDLISVYHNRIPMFGVCLGFQALVEYFGGELINLDPVRHGFSSQITIIQKSFLHNLPKSLEVGLYHSWGIEKIQLPDCLECVGFDSDNMAMAITHKNLPISGVQFHPESVMTPLGLNILENWINL